MSLVMARQFGNRICILSDTMVSDSNATRDDVIPGQLKTIVLNKKLTIAYSGLVNKSIHKIRKIRGNIQNGISLESILQDLCEFSIEENNEVDFIIASHITEPTLMKIANGNTYDGSDRYWIGNGEAATTVQKLIDNDTRPFDGLPVYVTSEEAKFKEAFHDVVSQRHITEVGGVAFYCLCSPKGHCYENHAMSVMWDTIPLDGTLDELARRKYERTGTAYYSFSLASADDSGLAVTGAFLPQNDIGYLYSPLDSDLDLEVERALGKPRKYHPINLEEFNNEVQRYASRLAKI